jgi:hypothetical protein
VPYATHTTHRIPAPRFDQASGPGNTDLNPTDDERRILDAARAAAVDLKRNFDNWVTMGRGLQLLRRDGHWVESFGKWEGGGTVGWKSDTPSPGKATCLGIGLEPTGSASGHTVSKTSVPAAPARVADLHDLVGQVP